jgi:hypothetical protein
MGVTLAPVFYGPLYRLSYMCGLEGLFLFCVEAESSLCLDPCLKAGIEGLVILTILYSSADLWTHFGPEEHVLVVVGDGSTLAGSDITGAE